MISFEHRCIFIHIPKCAGTSIEAALGHHDQLEIGKGRQDHRAVRLIQTPIPPSAYLTPSNLRELVRRYRWQSRDTDVRNKLALTPEQYRDFYKFSFVRNPWARAYSWYKNVIRDPKHHANHDMFPGISFDEFLKRNAGRKMLRPQMYWLKEFDGSINMDFIGKFENLASDFSIVCQQLGIKTPPVLPHEIKGSSERYHDQYSSETRDLLARIYKEEIRMFNYSFE